MLVYGAIVAALALMFIRIPTGFLPDEDQGVMFLQVTTPPGASLASMEQALAAVRDYVLTEEKDGISSILEVYGFSFSGRGQNAGHRVLHAQGLGRAAGGAEPRAGDRRPHHRALRELQGRHDLCVPTAADLRAGQRHRLRPRANGPGRYRPRRPDACAQSAARSGQEEPPRCKRFVPMARTTSRITRSTSTGRRPARSACPSAPSMPRCPRPGAPPTSTSSSMAVG